MRVLTNLLLKVTVSAMVLTAPAMIEGNTGGTLLDREAELPFASSTVIRNYIDHLKIWPVRAYVDRKSMVTSFPYISAVSAIEKNEVIAPVVEKKEVIAPKVVVVVKEAAAPMVAASVTKAAELRRVINESAYIYSAMGLEKAGLSEEAFEYAWRGYHNLVKKGSIRKKRILSIADFSQSSSEKRM